MLHCLRLSLPLSPLSVKLFTVNPVNKSIKQANPCRKTRGTDGLSERRETTTTLWIIKALEFNNILSLYGLVLFFLSCRLHSFLLLRPANDSCKFYYLSTPKENEKEERKVNWKLCFRCIVTRSLVKEWRRLREEKGKSSKSLPHKYLWAFYYLSRLTSVKHAKTSTTIILRWSWHPHKWIANRKRNQSESFGNQHGNLIVSSRILPLFNLQLLLLLKSCFTSVAKGNLRKRIPFQLYCVSDPLLYGLSASKDELFAKQEFPLTEPLNDSFFAIRYNPFITPILNCNLTVLSLEQKKWEKTFSAERENVALNCLEATRKHF